MGDGDLPLRPAESSNGEFLPRPVTADERAIAREAQRRVDEIAGAHRIDRRRVLRSAGGVAALPGAVNLAACVNGGASGYESPPNRR